MYSTDLIFVFKLLIISFFQIISFFGRIWNSKISLSCFNWVKGLNFLISSILSKFSTIFIGLSSPKGYRSIISPFIANSPGIVTLNVFSYPNVTRVFSMSVLLILVFFSILHTLFSNVFLSGILLSSDFNTVIYIPGFFL